MLAFRDCTRDRSSALALAATDGGSEYLHGILYEAGPQYYGIPLDIGYLVFTLLAPDQMLDFLLAIEEGADLSGFADEFALWALQRYALPCAEGDHTARQFLRFALLIARARCDRRPIDQNLEERLGVLTASRPSAIPQTVPDCAFFATWGVLQLKPNSAAIVAFAALRAEELIAGKDTAARRAMVDKLMTLLPS